MYRKLKTQRQRAWLVVALLMGVQAHAIDHVGNIEFFGYKGFDISKVRGTLPVHEGDEYSD